MNVFIVVKRKRDSTPTNPVMITQVVDSKELADAFILFARDQMTWEYDIVKMPVISREDLDE